MKVTVFFIFLLMHSAVAFAQTDICKSISSAQDILKCVLERHPSVTNTQYSIQQGEGLESVARKFPNPEAEFESVSGTNLGDKKQEVEAKLSQLIEIGGKRGSRIDKAQAEKASFVANVRSVKEEITIKTISSLYRARQLQDEFHALEEALDTFAKIQRQYRSRARLTPEQEVSLGIFQLAESDYKMRLSSLKPERRALEIFFKIAAQLDYSTVLKNSPKLKETWPTLRESTSELASASIQAAEAEFKLAQAEYSLAKAESWPDLKASFIYQNNIEGPFAHNMYGFGISMPLPLFNLNGGGRAYALAGRSKAEVNLRVKKQEIISERSKLLEFYESAITALKESVNAVHMEKKHKNMEALFRRGVIPSSLIIEAHRQILDFTNSRNEQELRAIEALWTIYAIDGRIFEEKL